MLEWPTESNPKPLWKPPMYFLASAVIREYSMMQLDDEKM